MRYIHFITLEIYTYFHTISQSSFRFRFHFSWMEWKIVFVSMYTPCAVFHCLNGFFFQTNSIDWWSFGNQQFGIWLGNSTSVDQNRHCIQRLFKSSIASWMKTNIWAFWKKKLNFYCGSPFMPDDIRMMRSISCRFQNIQWINNKCSNA